MQVTQRTTQQGRPQIRILVTCGQVVNAYQDDRVQDDDLTEKDYFLFRTHGTEQVPRSVVLFALRVSTAATPDYTMLPWSCRRGPFYHVPMHTIVFLYLRQILVLNTVVWKDGRAQTHVLGCVLFEIDKQIAVRYRRGVFKSLLNELRAPRIHLPSQVRHMRCITRILENHHVLRVQKVWVRLSLFLEYRFCTRYSTDVFL